MSKTLIFAIYLKVHNNRGVPYIELNYTITLYTETTKNRKHTATMEN